LVFKEDIIKGQKTYKLSVPNNSNVEMPLESPLLAGNVDENCFYYLAGF